MQNAQLMVELDQLRRQTDVLSEPFALVSLRELPETIDDEAKWHVPHAHGPQPKGPEEEESTEAQRNASVESGLDSKPPSLPKDDSLSQVVLMQKLTAAANF